MLIPILVVCRLIKHKVLKWWQWISSTFFHVWLSSTLFYFSSREIKQPYLVICTFLCWIIKKHCLSSIFSTESVVPFIQVMASMPSVKLLVLPSTWLSSCAALWTNSQYQVPISWIENSMIFCHLSTF